MASNAELQAEVDRLNAENEELATANQELSAALDAAEAEKSSDANNFKDKTPLEPSYGLTEGNREELERLGHTISPFTGARLVGTGLDDVREVSQEEYDRVAGEAAKKEDARPNKGMRFPKAADAV
jgi:hypothetical protein